MLSVGFRADQIMQSNASSGKFSKVSIIYTETTSFTGMESVGLKKLPLLTLYRDVKMQNILLTAKGVLKLGTSANQINNLHPLTTNVKLTSAWLVHILHDL